MGEGKHFPSTLGMRLRKLPQGDPEGLPARPQVKAKAFQSASWATDSEDMEEGAQLAGGLLQRQPQHEESSICRRGTTPPDHPCSKSQGAPAVSSCFLPSQASPLIDLPPKPPSPPGSWHLRLLSSSSSWEKAGLP